MQWLLGTRVAVKPVVPPPESPVAVPELPPVQKPVMPLGDAIIKPAGSVSVKATPVSVAIVLGLLTSKVSTEVPLSGMLVGLNDLVTTGG